MANVNVLLSLIPLSGPHPAPNRATGTRSAPHRTTQPFAAVPVPIRDR